MLNKIYQSLGRNKLTLSLTVISCITLTAIGYSRAKNISGPKRFGVVVPGQIYRSGQISKEQIECVLKKYRIEIIVDLTGYNPRDLNQEAEEKAADKLGITHYRLPLRGNGTGDIEYYVQAINIMVDARKAGKPVLVHCAAGTQRAGGVTAMYRLLIQHQKPSMIIKELMKYGWEPMHDGELLDYLFDNRVEMARQLRDLGVIPK